MRGFGAGLPTPGRLLDCAVADGDLRSAEWQGPETLPQPVSSYPARTSFHLLFSSCAFLTSPVCQCGLSTQSSKIERRGIACPIGIVRGGIHGELASLRIGRF